MATTTLETIRRAIADLLAGAVAMVLLFTITSLVHWVTNLVAGSIEPSKAFRSTQHFLELTLFGANAAVAVALLIKGVWTVFRAIFSNGKVGAE